MAPGQPKIPADQLQREKYHAALFHRVSIVKIPLLIVGYLPRQVKAQIQVASLAVQRGQSQRGVASIGQAHLSALKNPAGHIEDAVGVKGHGFRVQIHKLLIGGGKIGPVPGSRPCPRQQSRQ